MTGVERERICAYRKRVWIDRRRARAHFNTPETHLDRRAPSEIAFQHSRNAFGSTGVERERIWECQKGIWIVRRRARAHVNIQEMHLGRQVSIESTVARVGNSICIALVNKVTALFVRQNKYFLRFADSRRCCLRRSDGTSPTRSNSISLDKNNTSSARAIHEKSLALHT